MNKTLTLYARADEGVREIVISKTEAKEVLKETKSVKNVTSQVLQQVEMKQQQHVERTAQLETKLDEKASAILIKLSKQHSDATLIPADSVTTRYSISKWDERFQDQLTMSSESFSTWQSENTHQLSIWSTFNADSTPALARATSAATDMETASAISAATVATATSTAVTAKEKVLKYSATLEKFSTDSVAVVSEFQTASTEKILASMPELLSVLKLF